MILLAGLAMAAMAGAAQAAERGFTVAGFDRVRTAGPFDVVVKVGGPISVRASGRQAAIDRLQVTSEGGQLRIDAIKGGWGGWDADLGRVTVAVTMPSLRAVALAGSGNVAVDRVRSTAFDAAVAGSGDLTVGTVQADALTLTLNGSGDLTVSGRAARGKVVLTGSGDIHAAGLTLGTAQVAVAGSGGAALAATGTAAVSLVGSGDVTITGPAKCAVTKRGSGDVVCGR